MGIWGRRVVVVDDDTDTLDLLGAILREHGAEVIPVDQPGAALATILGVMPDVVLIDIAMPGLDGVSLIRKLRSLSPERGGRIPAATVSAAANTDDEIALWQAAGFQKHVRKPFPPPDIVAVVEDLAGKWVERRAVARDRREWPTPRERRSERRTEPPTGMMTFPGDDSRVLRLLA